MTSRDLGPDYSLRPIGDLRIRCTTCGAEYLIDVDDLDEDVVCIGEGGMGEQLQHSFIREIDCDNCGQSMLFKLYGFEYPVGAKDYQDSEAVGCEIVEEPYLVMRYIPEPLLSAYERILFEPKEVYDLEPWEFEELVAQVYSELGFDVKLTPCTKDGGKDIIATCEVGGIRYSTYFECKRYGPDNPVGVDVVRSLIGVMETERVSKGVIVTSSRFSREAVEAAANYGERLHLVDFKELQWLMRMNRGLVVCREETA